MVKDNMKRIIYITVVLVIVIVSVLVFFSNKYDIRFSFYSPKATVYTSKYLTWDSSLNRKQSGNTCGAHAAMAFLYENGKGINDPYLIYDSFSKMKNGYVFPWEITKYLKRNNVNTKIRNFWFVNDKVKNEWIKNEVQKNNPVIVIIGNTKYLHYITVLGFENSFYSIYDSEVVKDLNKENPGNIDVSENELIKKMNTAVFSKIKLKMMIIEES